MNKEIISIREEQSEWLQDRDIDLSQFVREAIDEKMGPTDEELAEAYQDNVDHAAEVNEVWSDVSLEANERLGELPETK